MASRQNLTGPWSGRNTRSARAERIGHHEKVNRAHLCCDHRAVLRAFLVRLHNKRSCQRGARYKCRRLLGRGGPGACRGACKSSRPASCRLPARRIILPAESRAASNAARLRTRSSPSLSPLWARAVHPGRPLLACQGNADQGRLVMRRRGGSQAAEAERALTCANEARGRQVPARLRGACGSCWCFSGKTPIKVGLLWVRRGGCSRAEGRACSCRYKAAFADVQVAAVGRVVSSTWRAACDACFPAPAGARLPAPAGSRFPAFGPV